MKRMQFKVGALVVASLSASWAAFGATGTLEIPVHGSPRLDLPTEQIVKSREGSIRHYQKMGASARELDRKKSILAKTRSEWTRLEALLKARRIDPAGGFEWYSHIRRIIAIPNGMTLVIAERGSVIADLLFFSSEGELQDSVRAPGGRDTEICRWREFARAEAFWFPIDGKTGDIGVVFSYTLGDPWQRSGYASHLFAHVFVLSAKGDITPGPLVHVSSIDLWNPSNPDSKKPSLGRALLGDTDGDGFQDIVFWRKQYQETDERPCFHLKKETAFVVRFSPKDRRFLEPVEDRSVLPIDEGLWYGSWWERRSKPEPKERVWPVRSDPAESAGMDTVYCDGEMPGVPPEWAR